MSKILELREKRAKAWDAAKQFLDAKRGADGMQCKIGGKHTLKGVGKNPRLAQAKSKNDKNISGLLNQIIDNKEAGKIGIHTFTNASSFNVGESDVKIISIEFAASEEVMAQFFGSVILSVKANQIERSVMAKTDVVIPSVEVTGVEPESDETDSLEDDEPEVIGNTKEQTVSVELPVTWKEDGQALVHFTFEFNDSIIEIHQPEEHWHSGRHSIALYYPIEGLIANYRNIFNVYMRVEGGSATVDVGDCLAGIMGQSMGAGEAWDGEIKIEEYIKRVNIGGAIKMAKVDENIGWIIDETLKRSYSDTVHGRVAIGAYTIFANAKAMADKNPGYEVYDWNGKQVYPEVAEGVNKTDTPFLVKVSIPDLNIRKDAGTNTAKTGICTGVGVFTIMEVKSGKGSDSGWGRLKSGAGWISLDYCQRV